MAELKLYRYDKVFALLFAVLSLLFVILAFTSRSFFNWIFERHQNQLSWYIRPLFLVPFCFFAFKRSGAGISVTIFMLLTSMFWFPGPDNADGQVWQFLDMEKEWLYGNWTFPKILMTLLIPITFIALGNAIWKRNLWFGLSIVFFMAVAKMIWSVVFGGDSGKSVILPALVGLLVCTVLIFLGFRRLEKKKREVNSNG